MKLRPLMILLLVATILMSASTSAFASSPTPEPTELVFWTYVDLHSQFMEDAANRWNEMHPDEPITIKSESYPVDEMHSKLLITLQSGQGAPDLVDVNVAKFSNFMRGDNIGFIGLNDIIEPEKEAFLEAVLDIYKKDDTYYAIEYHVGAPVIYYNTDILDAAGVKVEDLIYWSDVAEAGKKVLAATGKPMITFEVADSWMYYIMISEQKSDWLDDQGNVIMDNQINIDTLQFMLDMINEGTAITTPGGGYHTEEWYGFMANGGAAAMLEPLWYMGRFTDFMPELKGKIKIAPIPKWTDDDVSPVFGGTGTAITTQSKNQDLAKRFLYEAKISKQGSTNIWTVLGFDPLRMDIWDSDAMKEPNIFTDYFGTGIFDTIIKMKDSFYPTNVTDPLFPSANLLIANDVLFNALTVRAQTPAEVLKDAADELRSY
ncbi:MAG: ABC transporter substrate-binding protein [Christensenellales bacterium]|jgi:arabinosaccharide transport system substrate-binding protein